MIYGSRQERFYSRSRDRKLVSDINVTPFVDVMLVLLVVFMISAPLLVHGVKVSLPKNSSAPVVDNESFNLVIDKNGKIYYQEDEVPLEDLAVFIRSNVLSLNSKIYVRGDRNINYGSIMNVIAEINKAGYSKVALITDNS